MSSPQATSSNIDPEQKVVRIYPPPPSMKGRTVREADGPGEVQRPPDEDIQADEKGEEGGSGLGTELGPDDLAWLEKRAITGAQVAAVSRIRRVEDLPEDFKDRGRQVVPAYLFTWRCASGRVVLQIRPDKPPKERDGRAMKYLFPAGSGGVVAVAPGSEEAILDPTCPLLLVEGTCQHLAVASALAGVTIVGRVPLTGVNPEAL